MTTSRRGFLGILGIAVAAPVVLRGEAVPLDDYRENYWEDELELEDAADATWEPAPGIPNHRVQVYGCAEVGAFEYGMAWFAGPARIYAVGTGYRLDIVAHTNVHDLTDILAPPIDTHFSTKGWTVRMDSDVALTADHGMDVSGLVAAKADGTLICWVPVGAFLMAQSTLTLSSGNDFLMLSYA
jgi:hypothetical protein